jgi:hypothetical protein
MLNPRSSLRRAPSKQAGTEVLQRVRNVRLDIRSIIGTPSVRLEDVDPADSSPTSIRHPER